MKDALRVAHRNGECPEGCSYCAAEDAAWEKKRAEQIARGWREETCSLCGGFGVVSDYRGGDFNGAMDCVRCNSGTFWRSPNGRRALWPGGPFCG